jgi:hypothetical protein
VKEVMFKTIKARRGIIGTAAALSLLAAGAVAGVAIADDAAVAAKAPRSPPSSRPAARSTRSTCAPPRRLNAATRQTRCPKDAAVHVTSNSGWATFIVQAPLTTRCGNDPNTISVLSINTANAYGDTAFTLTMH